MKLRNILSILTVLVTVGFYSCDDTVSTLGSSLLNSNAEVVIDSSFTISGVPTPNNDIQSRTVVQILGSLSAKEYGDSLVRTNLKMSFGHLAYIFI